MTTITGSTSLQQGMTLSPYTTSPAGPAASRKRVGERAENDEPSPPGARINEELRKMTELSKAAIKELKEVQQKAAAEKQEAARDRQLQDAEAAAAARAYAQSQVDEAR
eukprot:2588368-Prymnesium_polylepis.2